MTEFTFPSRDKLDALLALSKLIKHGTEIPHTVDGSIADLLGVPRMHYTTSMDRALELRDIIFAGAEYLNLDMREYDDERGLVFLMKIENDYGESNGRHHTRPGALLDALLNHVICEVETAEAE